MLGCRWLYGAAAAMYTSTSGVITVWVFALLAIELKHKVRRCVVSRASSAKPSGVTHQDLLTCMWDQAPTAHTFLEVRCMLPNTQLPSGGGMELQC